MVQGQGTPLNQACRTDCKNKVPVYWWMQSVSIVRPRLGIRVVFFIFVPVGRPV